MSERNGPRVHGPRFAPGGYQGPRTNATALERGRPVHSQRWQRGALVIELALVPMLRGRPELYELEYKWNDPAARQSMYCPCMIRGERFAREAFALTASELDAGRLPDQVLTPPGTPLGP